MFQPENRAKKYDHLFSEIDSGRIKIPKFQRDFVWGKEQTAKLIDSIIKGYPIGTFIFWKTREELRYFKNIGNITLPDTPKGDAIFYVLDGQQRITSLYAVKKGVRITKDNSEEDYKNLCIDLSLDPEDDEQVVMLEQSDGTQTISLYKLLNGSLTDLYDEYDRDQIKKIEVYQKRLTGYDFSTVVISEYPIDTACEIFTRINTGGTELTLFEIMVAKTFDQNRNFDLAREYDWLIDNKGAEKDLEDAGFETIPSSTVLQCIAAHISQQIKRRDILKLNKADVIDEWPTVKNGIFSAVDYIRSHLRIPVSRLLPYNALLVPLTYFFIRNTGDPPTPKQHKLLTQYFFWASFSSRFTSAVESKIGLDLKRMDAILQGSAPDYHGEEVEIEFDDLKWKWFSTGDAFCKAILCIYAYQQPKSFESNSIVHIDNSALKIISSKNYHHFFPRGYLKKIRWNDWTDNSILNITIVDDFLNKRKIGAKAPAQYMKKFEKNNPELAKTMKTHLIDNLNTFGIWDNDYERFLKKRGIRVLKEIKKRLWPNI